SKREQERIHQSARHVAIAAEYPLDLACAADPQLKRFGQFDPTKRDFADIILDMPKCDGSAWQKQYVAGAKAPGLAVPVADGRRSFDKINRLVDFVGPFELAGGAIPHDGRRQAVGAAR